jgi:hypothetical protein
VRAGLNPSANASGAHSKANSAMRLMRDVIEFLLKIA